VIDAPSGRMICCSENHLLARRRRAGLQPRVVPARRDYPGKTRPIRQHNPNGVVSFGEGATTPSGLRGLSPRQPQGSAFGATLGWWPSPRWGTCGRRAGHRGARARAGKRSSSTSRCSITANAVTRRWTTAVRPSMRRRRAPLNPVSTRRGELQFMGSEHIRHDRLRGPRPRRALQFGP
jgi:hypothetical protein